VNTAASTAKSETRHAPRKGEQENA
jgi:hypothetical protein